MSEGVSGGPVPGAENASETRGTTLKKRLIFLVIIAVIALGAVFAFRVWQSIPKEAPTEAAPVEVSETEEVLTVLPETPVYIAPESEAIYRSERFRVGEIAIGGEFALIVPENDPTPLEISSVRGEAFTEKETNNTKLLLSWRTNKPAVSEVAYGKGVGLAEAVVREEEYGLEHSIVIPGLSQATTYVYVIRGQDKWGNASESDPYAVYTGSREISLFELIAGAVGDVFGWTVD
jgi:hypothetical protein